MGLLISLLHDEKGASAAEYAMISAIIGAALAVAALYLGNAISNSMNDASEKVTNCGGSGYSC